MKLSVTKGFVSVSALALLAACGGSSTSSSGLGITTQEADRQLFAADAGTLGAALEAGETVSARAVATSALQRDYDNQASSVLEDVLVQVKKNADGELTLIVDGNEVAFGTADRFVESNGEVYGYEQDGANFYYSLFSWSGEVDEVLALNNGNARPISFYFEEPDSSTAALGYAILGTETGADNLPISGTANLSGYSVITLFPQEGLTSFNDTRERLRGDVEMSVDFGTSEISGEIFDLEYQEPPNDGNVRADYDGTISMDATTFNANGFEGTLTMDAAGLAAFEIDDASVGTYGGTFYGDSAQQAAGTISSTVINDNGTFNGYGFFVAD